MAKITIDGFKRSGKSIVGITSPNALVLSILSISENGSKNSLWQTRSQKLISDVWVHSALQHVEHDHLQHGFFIDPGQVECVSRLAAADEIKKAGKPEFSGVNKSRCVPAFDQFRLLKRNTCDKSRSMTLPSGSSTPEITVQIGFSQETK